MSTAIEPRDEVLPVFGHMQGERFLQLRLLTVAIAYVLDDYRRSRRQVRA